MYRYEYLFVYTVRGTGEMRANNGWHCGRSGGKSVRDRVDVIAKSGIKNYSTHGAGHDWPSDSRILRANDRASNARVNSEHKRESTEEALSKQMLHTSFLWLGTSDSPTRG